jgi:hypothetical protein
MTSTQRSESANHMLKGFVPPGSSMNMFIRHYEKLQFDRDAEENFQEMRCRVVSSFLPMLAGTKISSIFFHVFTKWTLNFSVTSFI